MNIDSPLHLSLVIAGLGLAFSCIEDLARFNVFRSGGLLDWDIAKLRANWTMSGRLSGVLDWLFAGERYRGVLWAILLVAVAAPSTLWFPQLIAPIAGLLLIAVMLMTIRSLYGTDGSDQMNLIVLAAAFATGVTPAESIAAQAVLWLVASQLTLAYVIAGVAKLWSAEWRSGQALIGVMSTESYGHPGLHRWLSQNSGISKLACWAVIGIESAFPIVFVLDDESRLVVLAGMALFHASCAVFMGLNNFLFAFIAAYPALWHCARVTFDSL